MEKKLPLKNKYAQFTQNVSLPASGQNSHLGSLGSSDQSISAAPAAAGICKTHSQSVNADGQGRTRAREINHGWKVGYGLVHTTPNPRLAADLNAAAEPL